MRLLKNGGDTINEIRRRPSGHIDLTPRYSRPIQNLPSSLDSESVARKLALAPGTPVVRIQRVRLADNAPLSFDETHLPREIGEKILENDLETEPIFSLLEQKYNTPLVEAEYCLEAVTADATVARALGIGVGSPIFLIERTSYTTGHRPIDYEKLYYRGDQIRFVTRLARRGGTDSRMENR